MFVRTLPRFRRTLLLAVLALLAVTALALHGPIVQWPGYHGFADARAWASVPNAFNVLSNLPFAIAGLWAWPRLREAGAAWRAFCVAIIATAFGSSIYHWQPDNLTLLIDRLPIAWVCSTLLCSFLAERVDAVWQSPRVVACALFASSAAVVWWGVGTALGTGDLRPYAFVQFLPMLLIPAALLMRLPALQAGCVPGGAWWAALALYACAKGLETADGSVMELLHVVGGLSGHTLKHLLAAVAAALLLHARASRRDQLR
ncbi:MAG: hypothetical protein ABW190_17170 [Rhizobacter sp.]